MAIIFNPAEASQLDSAVALLRKNCPIGLPTETVYGLAGRIDSERALSQIFQLKNRPNFDPLIVHVLDAAEVENYVDSISPVHQKLMDHFWPGPLTILFEKNAKVSDLCTAGSKWVAIRSPKHPVFRQILKALKVPLAAPSANRFGRISPTSSRDVVEELGPWGLEGVVEGGRCELGLESTVVKVHSAENLEVIRLGSIDVESLQKVLGRECQIEVRASGSGDQREAPGQLKSHYSPRAPLRFFANEQELLEALPSDRATLVSVFPLSEIAAQGFHQHIVLSPEKSYLTATARLFSTLREIDRQKPAYIYAVGAPEELLGRAINDRLRRASCIK